MVLSLCIVRFYYYGLSILLLYNIIMPGFANKMKSRRSDKIFSSVIILIDCMKYFQYLSYCKLSEEFSSSCTPN